MNFAKTRVGKALIDAAVIFGLFIVTCFSYVFLKPTFGLIRNGVVPQIITTVAIAGVVGVGVFLYYRKKLSFFNIVLLLFFISFLVKLCYMLNTPYNARQYDTITPQMDGHEGYAWTLFTTGKLPSEVDHEGHLMYQFYHPPLNALIQAGFMQIFKPILEGYNAISGTNFYDTSDIHTLYQTTLLLSLVLLLLLFLIYL